MSPTLKPAEAAALLGISPSTLAHWRSAGRGPRWIKPHAHLVRYDRAEVERWLRSREQGTGD